MGNFDATALKVVSIDLIRAQIFRFCIMEFVNVSVRYEGTLCMGK